MNFEVAIAICLIVIDVIISLYMWLASSLQQFQMNPNPVEYDSGRRRLADETGLNGCFGNDPTTCSASAVPTGDGRRQPTSLTDLSSTFAWNQDVTITMGLSQAARVRAVTLYFYNIPLMGIGLPHEIELNWGNTNLLFTPNRLGRAVLGNSDLNQEDNTTRNVTIAAIADDSGDGINYTSISITFCFSGASPIRWLILSEVEICTGQGMYIDLPNHANFAFIAIHPNIISIPVNLTPRQGSIPLTTKGDEVILLQSDSVQSQINLTCTVQIEGSFQYV